MNQLLISIEGNIGAGKTSLATMLAQEWNAALILEEFAENAFLHQFYQDPEKLAFPLELSFLAARYKQMTEQIPSEEHTNLIISDYHVEKSLLFANLNLKGSELELYRTFFSIINPLIRKPDLLVYLDNTPGHSLNNIKIRKRGFEQNIREDYLNSIHESYQSELSRFISGKILNINTSEIDFVNNRTDYEKIRDAISGELSISNC